MRTVKLLLWLADFKASGETCLLIKGENKSNIRVTNPRLLLLLDNCIFVCAPIDIDILAVTVLHVSADRGQRAAVCMSNWSNGLFHEC